MRNKLMLLLSALMVATLVLAACGGGNEATPAPAAPAEATTEATTEATVETATEAATEAMTDTAPMTDTGAMTDTAPMTDTTGASAAPAAGGPALTIWADGERAPVLTEIGKNFTDQYGVPVNVVEKPIGDLRNDFKVAAPTGEGPDIILGAHDWIGELIASGLLAEVSLGDKTDMFAPAAVQGFTFTDGKLYGMPQAVENVAFYYNTDLVPTAPTTWEEVATISKEVQAAGAKYGFLIQTNDPYHFYPIQTAFGGYVFGKNDDGSYNAGDIGINSEGSVAAFDWLNQMYEDGLLVRGANIDSGLLLSAFQNGEAAMLISGPWALNGFREASVPFAVAPIPSATQPGRPFLGIQGFMINAFSKNQLLAQTFLQEFVATDDTMQAMFDADPRVSAWMPVAEKIADPELSAFVAAGATADPMPNIPEMNSVWSAWGDAMTLISNGELVPQEALDQAQQQIETAIAGQ